MNTLNRRTYIQIVLYEKSSSLIIHCFENLKDLKIMIVDNKGNKN